MILLAAIYYLTVSGNFGDGSTPSAPIDCSGTPAQAAAKFDTFMRGKYITAQNNIEFHLGPGTFYTRRHRDLTVAGLGGIHYGSNDCNWANWSLLNKWRFFGAGMNSTIVKLLPVAFYPSDPTTDGIHITGSNDITWNHATAWGFPASQPRKCAYGGTVFFQEPWDLVGQEIHDLTVDCSWSDFGCLVTSQWTVPVDGANVTVSVLDETKFTAGKYVELHHTGALYARRKPIGTFEVVSINGNSIEIKSVMGTMGQISGTDAWKFEQPGTVIPAGCLMAPRQNTCGIALSANGCKITNVRVTNTGTPIYEGHNAIGFDYGNFSNATSGYCQINNNVVDTTWGTYGWGINSLVNNFATDSNRTRTNPNNRVIGEVLNNSFFGNGYDKGGIGNADVTYRGNYYKNCILYCDTGFTTNVLFENNVIDGGSLGFANGARNPDGSPGFAGWIFRNNTIKHLIGEHAFWSFGGLKNWKIVSNDFSVHPDFATWGVWHKSRAFCFQTQFGHPVHTQVISNQKTGFNSDDIGLDVCMTKPSISPRRAKRPAHNSN
jgi:hypothetical protein